MSESKHRDFLDYWDSRFDENEKILNSYPQLANFTFRECNRLLDNLDAEYATLLASHNALVEAVKKYFKSERLEILKRDARAEVDRLIGEDR